MLFFLAENNCITSEHLRMIWVSALSRACDADTAEEVLTALVRLCRSTRRPFVSIMMGFAIDSDIFTWEKERDKSANSTSSSTSSTSSDYDRKQRHQHQQEQHLLAQSQLSKIAMMLSKIESAKLFDKRTCASDSNNITQRGEAEAITNHEGRRGGLV